MPTILLLPSQLDPSLPPFPPYFFPRNTKPYYYQANLFSPFLLFPPDLISPRCCLRQQNLILANRREQASQPRQGSIGLFFTPKKVSQSALFMLQDRVKIVKHLPYYSTTCSIFSPFSTHRYKKIFISILRILIHAYLAPK